MLFTSTVFLLFLLVFVPVYFALPHRARALWITAGSYYFYTYGHLEYWWLLFTCTIVAYLGGLAMARWDAVWQRRLALWLGVGVNVGLLVYFKYGELIVRTWKTTLKAWHFKSKVHIPHLILPIGISFFTFQALAYLFDVYRRRFPAERRLDVFAAYKAFFPQLVAGPIERPGNVIPQLHQEHRWDFDRTASGLRLMLWGFFKKLVIADHLAVAVREAYGSNSSSSLQLILGTYAFAWQIFCDFSAYTDIARGCARILGIDLMENFRQPYFAKSIPEFWSRWHISLSTWFRDYLYIPLGGNRGGWWSWQRNLLIVFLVSGLWHGADWKFALWGLLHAAFFLGANLFAKIPSPRTARPRWLQAGWNGLKIFVTFQLVCVAWVFFRAKSTDHALQILGRIVHHPLQGPFFTRSFGLSEFLFTAGAIMLLEAVHLFRERRGSVGAWLDRCPVWVRWPAYYVVIIAIFTLAPAGQQEFIYFQF
ncbi:MAG TPA: MBOAT family O-acyltransferase [Chthoniobacteraceae bacterium]|jgi:D-alanyl-lipoteichoic acid acyltransferase DltB (MBOAT superfamily)|nr:MBOAT family O-acyltransferase [Chthoniobacteraceae bacterium]